MMKENVRYIIFLILIGLLPAKQFGQKILNPEFDPPDKRFDNFQIKEGEVSQTSTSVFLDRRGFLWCGTDDGLYRYDGAKYVEYKAEKSENEIAGLIVSRIFEDSCGTIWAGTSQGLNKVNQSFCSLSLYVPDSTDMSITGNAVRSINEDRSGLMWIRTWKHVFSFDRKTERFTRYEVDSLSWYPVNYSFQTEEQSFLEDRHKNKWFITARGLYKLSNETGMFRLVLPDPGNQTHSGIRKVNCITSDSKGTIWIGTEGAGLMRWNETTDLPEKVNIQPGGNNGIRFNTITSILVGSDELIWAFGNNTFSAFNPIENSVQNYIFLYKNQTVYETPGSPVEVNQSFRLSDGSIWFFSRNAGIIYKFEPSSGKLYLYRTPTFVVFQCLLDKSETFWFACVRYNIFRMVRTRVPYFTIYPVNNTADVARVHKGSIIEDKSGRTWFLFNRGIYVVNNFNITSSVRFDQITLPGDETITTGGFADSKGYLWLGTKSGRILRFDPSSGSLKDFTPYNSPDDISYARVPLIREDKYGTIWIVTFNNRIFRLDPGMEKLEHVLDITPRSVKIELNWILDFLIDSRNDLWILTSDRVLRVQIPGFKTTDYSCSGGTSLKAIDANIRIREDSKGDILMLNAMSGLNRFDRENSSFSPVSLPGGSDVTGYYDLLIDRKGRYWIAHNMGITVFDPAAGRTRNISTLRLQYDVQGYQIKNGDIIYINDSQLFVFCEEIPFNNEIPQVHLTRLLVNGEDYALTSEPDDPDKVARVKLPFSSNNLSIEFASLNYLDPSQNRYQFFMKGIDRDTIEAQQGKIAEYRGMHPGNYTFWFTGSNNDGIWNPSGVRLDIRILPPWYSSVAAWISYILLILALIAAYIRKRTSALTSDKIRLEAEVKARTAELELKNRQLAELDRIKTNFFTDISHEIRTPLSLILGPLENISKEEMLSSRMTGMVDMMKRNAFRLMNLVNQLLDISKLDAGKMKITLTEDDIVKCLRILVYEFLSMAESKHIKYIADLPEEKVVTWFDRDKTEKIISNILSNAFKYTPENGIIQCIIKIESEPVENTPLNLRINISDSGPGISKEHQQRIFDRFYRIEGHYEAEGYGTGIGLSLVQEFVLLLHGKINVTSTPGKGSDFSVILPLGKEHLSSDEYIIAKSLSEPDLKTYTTVRKGKFISSLNGMTEKGKLKILLIEDNEDLRNYIRDTLSEEYYVLEENNGKTGINTAFTTMPDLIVTDIMMPDLDGITLCATIKNDERTSHIPVIMLTAKATTDEKLEGLSSGADDYIIKPFNMPELITRISNLLALRDKLRQKYSKINLLAQGIGMTDSVDDRFMSRVIKAINENLNDYSFDVGSLQEILGMSRMHLTRKLKILTGLTPGVLIRNIRLEKAAELLSQKAGNITKIASSVGISNPSSFTKAFRNYFGVSPKDYSKHQI